MLDLVTLRKLQILVWSFPSLFDETMQQNHPFLLVNIEKNPRAPVLR